MPRSVSGVQVPIRNFTLWRLSLWTRMKSWRFDSTTSFPVARAFWGFDSKETLNDQTKGFHRSTYEHNGEKNMVATQFEPADARQFFLMLGRACLQGNLISFMVYLAPIPTFRRIYRKKSTEGFQSLPYVVALFSAMLWVYYAFVKTNSTLLITINSVGCVIETVYIVMFLIYAPREARINTAKMVFLFDVGLFGLIILVTDLLAKGEKRLMLLGWICVGFAVSVFAAPLGIIRDVIRTKSTEYMPFMLSFFLTLSAMAWFSYGLFSRDIYVAIPNVLGFSFGVIQMVLYMIYNNGKKGVDDYKAPEHIGNRETSGLDKKMAGDEKDIDMSSIV